MRTTLVIILMAVAVLLLGAEVLSLQSENTALRRQSSLNLSALDVMVDMCPIGGTTINYRIP